MRNLERRDHCSVTVRDPTSLLITKMARDFTNKIMVTKCVFSKVSRGNVGNNQEGICNCIYYTLMFDLWGHRFIWKEWWHLWPTNNVKRFLWMKAENPNLVLWLSYWRCGVSRASKNLFPCFFVFGLFCCFAGYCGVILVSWFQWWSAILAAQWILFISCVNHGSVSGLVWSF